MKNVGFMKLYHVLKGTIKLCGGPNQNTPNKKDFCFLFEQGIKYKCQQET
jgi:hypothetical protein